MLRGERIDGTSGHLDLLIYGHVADRTKLSERWIVASVSGLHGNRLPKLRTIPTGIRLASLQLLDHTLQNLARVLGISGRSCETERRNAEKEMKLPHWSPQ